MAREAGHDTDTAERYSHAELTEDELAQVVGGDDTPPVGLGDGNGARRS